MEKTSNRLTMSLSVSKGSMRTRDPVYPEQKVEVPINRMPACRHSGFPLIAHSFFSIAAPAGLLHPIASGHNPFSLSYTAMDSPNSDNKTTPKATAPTNTITPSSCITSNIIRMELLAETRNIVNTRLRP